MAKSILDLKDLPPMHTVALPPKQYYQPKPFWCEFDWIAPLVLADDGQWYVQLGDRKSVRITAEEYRRLDPTAVIDSGVQDDGDPENAGPWAMLNAHSVLRTKALTFRERYEDEWMYQSWFTRYFVMGGEITATPETFQDLPSDWQVDPLHFQHTICTLDFFSDYSDDHSVYSAGHAQRGEIARLCKLVLAQSTGGVQAAAWVQFFVLCYNAMVSGTTSDASYLIDEAAARKYWFKI